MILEKKSCKLPEGALPVINVYLVLRTNVIQSWLICG